MKVVCDADGLIKLAKAGILEAFARRVDLLVAPTVYREAVEEGKARGHPDAWEIEQVLREHGRILQPPRGGRTRPQTPEAPAIEALPLGAGERETWVVFVREKADAVLSDDRGFLHALEAQGIPYLTPAAALVGLARQGTLSRSEALRALERLRPWIRREQYEAARRDLEALNGDGDGREREYEDDGENADEEGKERSTS